jgi:hypothetical protein
MCTEVGRYGAIHMRFAHSNSQGFITNVIICPNLVHYSKLTDEAKIPGGVVTDEGNVPSSSTCIVKRNALHLLPEIVRHTRFVILKVASM